MPAEVFLQLSVKEERSFGRHSPEHTEREDGRCVQLRIVRHMLMSGSSEESSVSSLLQAVV